MITNEALAQNLIINEVMSSNRTAFIDEFDSTPDWIELFNSSSNEINLSDYYLSDNEQNLNKWKLPNVALAPQSYYLILASGKDINMVAAEWETIIDRGDTWRYFPGNREPNSQWKSVEFDDSDWVSGSSGIGYGDGDDETIIDPVMSLYLRKEFFIDDLENITNLMFNMDFDDGYVAYINGYEISRENLGEEGELIPYFRSADNYREATLYQGYKLDAIHIDDYSSFLLQGKNVISIQVHNYNITSSDLSAIPYLNIGYGSSTGQKYISPDIELLITRPHTNFSISNGNEKILLSNSDSVVIDSVGSIFIQTDISYGRKLNDLSTWLYFEEATPGRENDINGYFGTVELPEVTTPPGFYQNSVSVELIETDDQVRTYYSLDGSVPDQKSSQYMQPIFIDETSVLKIKSFAENLIPSPTYTSTYFIDQNKELPIISISTDPSNLWDYETGIYVLGPNAEPEYPYFNANFWQDWERPANFEYFEIDRDQKINQDVIIKIFGGWSRGNAQKSLSLFAEGNKNFDYEFFPNLNLSEFRSIVLRNSGNDWNSTMLRDGFIHSLADELSIDNLAYQPAVLYLNGEYWGIQNIREKLNLNYITSHHDVKKQDISLLEHNGSVIDGTNEDYIEMIAFLNSHNLALDANYEIMKNHIDIASFIDYQLLEIFVANTDWPGNNVKFWRDNSENGKWRWILFDTDFGFNWIWAEDYTHNTLEFALEENGPEWPNPPWSTFILRKLLENKNFQNDFVNRYADLTNTTFLASNVKEKITEKVNKIKNEIQAHSDKWNTFTITEWVNNINTMNRFAEFRIAYLNNYFRERFGLGATVKINLNISNSNSGKIKINSIIPQVYPWNGEYFANTKINLIALPNPGYEFTGWSGVANAITDTISLDIEKNSEIKANFVKISDHPNLVINEINYNSSSSFDSEDWIEIYNNSDEIHDISNWKLKDENDNNIFIFPENLTVTNDDYFVICRDSASFRNLYGENIKIVGNFNFGLNNSGDLIRIYNKNDELIDSVRYSDDEPWPEKSDGMGSTLELINPDLDNSFAANWKSSVERGTPGAKNSSFIVGVDKLRDDIPSTYKLYQNYPNPFNPSTMLRYQLPENSKVKLEIFNINGQKITTLVNEEHAAGTYQVIWNGKNNSDVPVGSGVYIYRISTSKFNKANKMILMR